MRILIVEDDEVSASILDTNLRQRGLDTVVASSGSAALQLLETYWDIWLVLADIMMPDLDGLELVRRMREDAKWREIPVVICSSLADADHVAEAARLGCRHYLLKPVDRVQLLHMVDKIMASERPKPILEERAKMQEKYGLSADALNQMLKAFSRLLEETISVLASDSSQANENLCLPNFARLVEGSAALGAQRLLQALKSCYEKGVGNPLADQERTIILAEMNLIQRAIAAQMRIPAKLETNYSPAADCRATAGQVKSERSGSSVVN